MGEYASWVAMRWRRKAAARNFAGKALRKLTRFVPGRFRYAAGIMPLGSLSPHNDWNERALFLEQALQNAKLNPSSKGTRRPRIVHLIGSLQPGGAERQLCNCVIDTRRLGYEVTVLLLFKPTGEHDHYGALLAKEGVEVRLAGEHFDPSFKSLVKKLPGGESCLTTIPEEFCPWAIDVLGELLIDPPDVFHSWLDHPNVWSGTAALLANIPLIVLSTRNVNPTHFPYLASPYFHAMYTQFARSPSIRFINNSHAGADDYAKWLGMPKEKFSVVLNGVDFSELSRVSDQEISDFRNALSIPADGEIIAGVFRLSEEKQPLVFLDVVQRVMRRRPNVFAVIAGIGPFEQELKDYISTQQLGDRIFLLGRRTDIETIFSAATLKLLCSRQEGTPNVLLEAQWLGCPVISTKAGGAVDAVSHGETGFLVEVGDIDGLENAVLELLENASLRASMAKAGAIYIRKCFGMDRMVQETISIYNE
jgi:glycosyltransferase involved in cell wall biosynthesis